MRGKLWRTKKSQKALAKKSNEVKNIFKTSLHAKKEKNTIYSLTYICDGLKKALDSDPVAFKKSSCKPYTFLTSLRWTTGPTGRGEASDNEQQQEGNE